MRTIETAAGDVSYEVEGDAAGHPLVVLAHGAGADMNSPFMAEVSAGLVSAGLPTARFNFAYSIGGVIRSAAGIPSRSLPRTVFEDGKLPANTTAWLR